MRKKKEVLKQKMISKYPKMCLKGFLATLDNNLKSSQLYIKEKAIVKNNLHLCDTSLLHTQNSIVPLVLCMTELNSKVYELFEVFLLLMLRQLNWEFFLYKGLLFSKLKSNKFDKHLNKKAYKIII